jgi:hypothetical protein
VPQNPVFIVRMVIGDDTLKRIGRDKVSGWGQILEVATTMQAVRTMDNASNRRKKVSCCLRILRAE